MKFKQFIKAVVFLVLLPVIILPLDPVFSNLDYRTRQIWEGFYEEPEGSLDAVFIGASNVYSYWNSMTAWEEYGITVYAMSFPQLSYKTIEEIIDECRKTQPDALYIVSLNTYKAEYDVPWNTHLALDYMNWDEEKMSLVNDISEDMGLSFEERLEFYFPLIRFHSNWSALGEQDYVFEPNGFKSASNYWDYNYNVTSITGYYTQTNYIGKMEEYQTKALDGLMDHCSEEDVDLLFVSMPQAISTTSVEQMNAMSEYVESKGFDSINLNSYVDEMGLELRRDWYNRKHCNIHGSIKFTHYLGAYLVEEYGFSNKKDDPAYESWNEASQLYYEAVAGACLDFEYKNKKRNYEIAWTYLYEPVQYGNHIIVSWKFTHIAQGYAIYRCSCGPESDEATWGPWERVATVPADTFSYEDTSLFQAGYRYCYTVVPFSFDENGEMMYGNFSYNGIIINYQGEAPIVRDVSYDENEDAVITWQPVQDAEQYVIYRRRPDEPWNELDMISAVSEDGFVTEYTDESFLPGVPYFYTVGTAAILEDEDIEYGSYDSRGIFFENGVTCPDPTIVRTGDGYLVSWDEAPWFTGFEISFEDEDDELVTYTVEGWDNEYLISYDDTDGGNELYLSGYFEVDGEEVHYQSRTVTVPGGGS